jgi:hypothetical protein
MTPKTFLTARVLPFLGLAAIVTICLSAVPRIGSQSESPRLTGTWLAALEFTGQRPFQTVITFSEADANPIEEVGSGRWARIAGREFSIGFMMPAIDFDINRGSACKVTGTWTLDELGRLRGPLTVEVVDSTGRMVDSFRGIVNVKRIVIRGSSLARSSSINDVSGATVR